MNKFYKFVGQKFSFAKHYFSKWKKKVNLPSTIFLSQKNGAGFTLIELLTVIAIISLISSIVLSQLNEARAKSRDAVRIHDMQQIRRALELYYDENGVYPRPGVLASSPILGFIQSAGYIAIENAAVDFNWTTATSGGTPLSSLLQVYLKTIPKDPVGDGVSIFGTTGSGYVYIVSDDGLSYDLIGRFETNNHSQSCANRNYESHIVPGDFLCVDDAGADYFLADNIYSDRP